MNLPAEPGAYPGDIFFGDEDDSTKATHRWDGQRWKSLNPATPMNLPERIQRATQIADELNRDPMLCQEVKYLLLDRTAQRLVVEDDAGLVLSGGSRRQRPQFDLQPHR